MTPEGQVKAKVKAYLKSIGAYYNMPVPNGLGAPSLDFVGCYRGRFFAIETKAGSKGPTPRQEATMRSMEDAGGATFLINDDDDTWTPLHGWVSQINEELGDAGRP